MLVDLLIINAKNTIK